MSESNENQSGCGCIFSIIALIAGLAKIVISFSKLGGGSGAIIGIVVAIAIAIILFAIEASKEETNSDDDDDPTGYAAREKREKAKRKMQELQNSIEESNTKQEGSDTVTYGLNEVVNNETPTSSTEDKEEYDDEECEDKELVENFKKLIDCPCRFYGTDSSDELLKDYNESLERGKREGFFPFIIFVDDNLLMDIMFEFDHECDDEIDIEKIRTMRKELIANASSYEGKRWLDEMLKEYQEDSEHYQEILGTPSDEGYEIPELYLESSNEEYPALLAEVPVSAPWHLFAWFPFGNWNGCPDKKTLVNVGRYWFEQHGAVPAFITHDTLEMTVPQPVSDAQSLYLAKEQYAYCLDQVEQTGLQTIHALADSLRTSTVWHFWWD